MDITLLPTRTAHFDWLLAGTPSVGPDGLRCGEPEIESPEILVLLRDIAETAMPALGTGSWLIVAGHDVIGLCGIKALPDAGGLVEIGYGVAASHRGRGVASRAVALMTAELAELLPIAGVIAQTALANAASIRVLEHNGFERIGTRHDDEDGDLIVWRWTPRDEAG